MQCGGTHHCILGVGLLIVHLSDLLLRGSLHLAQNTEPLAEANHSTPHHTVSQSAERLAHNMPIL